MQKPQEHTHKMTSEKSCSKKQNSATHGWWGGICLHVYTQTHTHSALWQCESSDIAADPVEQAHSYRQHCKDQHPHPQTQKCTFTPRKKQIRVHISVFFVLCALFFFKKKPLVWGSWLTLLITETSYHISYTQSQWVSAVSFIELCTLYPALLLL